MHKTFGLILGAFALVAATPLAAQPRGDEPVAVPRTIKQGIDFVYVDPQMASVARKRQRPQNWLARLFDPGGASRQRNAPNTLFVELARGLQQYQASWGRLPQAKIPAGAALKRGSTGKASSSSARLGLSPRGGLDQRWIRRSGLHEVHAWPVTARRPATIASLTRRDPMPERDTWSAPPLPQTGTFERYVVVIRAAMPYMFDATGWSMRFGCRRTTETIPR